MEPKIQLTAIEELYNKVSKIENMALEALVAVSSGKEAKKAPIALLQDLQDKKGNVEELRRKIEPYAHIEYWNRRITATETDDFENIVFNDGSKIPKEIAERVSLQTMYNNLNIAKEKIAERKTEQHLLSAPYQDPTVEEIEQELELLLKNDLS